MEATEKPSPKSAEPLPSRVPTSSCDETGMRIALFVTCIGDTLFPQAGCATVQVLERLGHEVVFPEEQTCCGQMHMNNGHARGGGGPGRPCTQTFGENQVRGSPA